MSQTGNTQKNKNESTTRSVGVQRLVSVWKLFEPLTVCLLLMIPGHIAIGIYGLDGLTALPLFWGGMAYMAYLKH